MLRAGGTAARPDRVLVALITLVAILATAISLSGGPTETNGLAIAASQIELGTDGFVTSLLRADLQGLSDRLRMLLLEAPETAIRAEPLRTAGLLAVFVVCWGLGGLYICRGARDGTRPADTCETGPAVHVPQGQGPRRDPRGSCCPRR